MSPRPLLLVGLALASLACDSADQITKSLPKIAVEPSALDFGETPVDGVHELLLGISNIGSSPLSITAFEVEAPFFATSAPLVINPGELRPVMVAFRPKSEGQAAGVLKIRSDADQHPVFEVPLGGSGKKSAISVSPRAIDFGLVEKGAGRAARVAVKNDASVGLSALVRALDVNRPEHFALDGHGLSDPLPLSVAPMAVGNFSVAYSALASGSDGGRLIVETCGLRCGFDVSLLAATMSDALRIEPGVIDFGLLGLGAQVTRRIVVQNRSDHPIELRDLSIEGAPDATVVEPLSLPLRLPAGTSASVALKYVATQLGPITGVLFVSTDRMDIGRVPVALSGAVERALLVASPLRVDFGTVSGPSETRRPILLTNGGATRFAITSIALAGDAALTVQSPSLPASLDAGESVTAYVSFAPQNEGSFAGTVTIETDDAKAGATVVEVVGARGRPRCVVGMAPALLDFGYVEDESTRPTMTVQLTNSGPEPCSVTRIEVKSSAFSVLDATPLVLAPGAPVTVSMRFDGVSGTVFESRAIFHFDDPIARAAELQLTGSRLHACGPELTPDSPCRCEPGTRRTLVHRPGWTGSGVASGPGEPIFANGCAPDVGCEPGSVQVEVEPFQAPICQPAPKRCEAPNVLDFHDGAWSCEPCTVVVTYGGIYGGFRTCADGALPASCGPGDVPTFVYESHAWSCQRQCDNGLYDLVPFNGRFVCVPC